MQAHVKVIAILYIVFGALGLLAAVILLVTFMAAGAVGAAEGDAEAGLAIGGIGMLIGLCAGILALPQLITGWGLLKYKSWARIVAIVLAVLSLFSFPIGTAIGIYALWAMLNSETQALFESGGPGQPMA
jgi:hypothetical protein